MQKDKLVLADGTEIELETSSGISALTANVESKDAACDLWKKFTQDNLKQVNIKNADDLTIGQYPDLVLNNVTGADNVELCRLHSVCAISLLKKGSLNE